MCTGCHKSPHSHGVPNLHILQRVPLFLPLLPSFSVFSRSLLRYRAQRPPLSFSSAPSFATRRFASTRRASEFSSLARWRRTCKAVHRGCIVKTRGYRRDGPFRRVNRRSLMDEGRRPVLPNGTLTFTIARSISIRLARPTRLSRVPNASTRVIDSPSLCIAFSWTRARAQFAGVN